MSLEPPSGMKRAPSTDMQTTPSVSTSAPESETTPFGRPPSTPHQPSVPAPPPPSGFTQTSPFGMPSTSVFTQTPTFGQSSFDQLAASAPSPFSQASPPTFGSAAATTSGFGAFSSTTPAKFGQSAFGFGFGAAEQSPSTASAPIAPGHPSESGQEDGMAEDGPSLDGLGLGGLSSTDAESKPSIFGNSATPTSFQQPSSGGSNEGLIKSGVGFGVASDQNSPFAKPSSFTPSGPSFGQSTFGQTTTSPFTPSKLAFGQTSFQQPAFGQPAFGQTGLGQSQAIGSGGLAFGKPSFGSPPTTSRPPGAPATSTSGGAFGAFATDGATGFAAFANKVFKPVWAASEDQKNVPENSRAVFGPSTTSALAPAPEPALAKAEPDPCQGIDLHFHQLRIARFSPPNPADGSPPGDGILGCDRDLVLLKGDEKITLARLKSTSWLSTSVVGFRYWIHPGPFVQSDGIAGAKGRFLGWWAVLIQAAFSFIGAEIVAVRGRILGVTFPRQFAVSTFVSCSSALESGTAASPFTIAIQNTGIKVSPSLISTCLLSSAWSAASSDLYTSSRALYGLAVSGNAPRIFSHTTKSGLPLVSVLFCASFTLLAFMAVSSGADNVFKWFSNMTGLKTWFSITVTYLRFYEGFQVQSIDRTPLPYYTRLQPFAAWYACISTFIICLFNGRSVFLQGSWNNATFVTSYLPFVLSPILFGSAYLY
ncbi:amino acid permease-domain-containing protein [Pisolithus albus]|nr:amino acid permease-domain-containing protein [Pisolithus albus]